jgi:translation initiation factor 3 subunit B
VQGFPFEGFHLEDVMLPEDDDMGILSDDDEEGEEEIQTETGFGCVVGRLLLAVGSSGPWL